MVWSFSEKSKVAFVYFSKRSTDRKEGEKLSSLEPKVIFFATSNILQFKFVARISIIRDGRYEDSA